MYENAQRITKGNTVVSTTKLRKPSKIMYPGWLHYYYWRKGWWVFYSGILRRKHVSF